MNPISVETRYQICLMQKIGQLVNAFPYIHETGSRYFGTHNHHSDWDFIVLQNNETEKKLSNLGFIKTPVKNTDYFDNATKSVWIHGSLPIHVGVCSADLYTAKCRVIEYLKNNKEVGSITLEDMTNLKLTIGGRRGLSVFWNKMLAWEYDDFDSNKTPFGL